MFGAWAGVWFFPHLSMAQLGVPVWTNRHAGSGNIVDTATALTVGDNGNVYVTGYSSNLLSSYDYMTVGYSPSGLLLWTNSYNGSANGNDRALAIGTDRSNIVYVTGLSFRGSSGHDFATIAYSPDGYPLWTNYYGGIGSADDYPQALTVGKNGNVYVVGNTGGGSRFTTIAYSNNGVPLWTNLYQSAQSQAAIASCIVVGANDNVYVGGYSSVAGNIYDYVAIAYSSTGIPLWTNRYGGSGSEYDYAVSIAASANGNIYLTGRSTGLGTGFDFATIGYSSNGIPLWTNRCNQTVDLAVSVATDKQNNVFVTGYSSNGTNYDFLTIAYSSTGLALWTNRYNGSANNSDQATAVVVDHAGVVYVIGNSYSPGASDDYVIIAYSNSGVPMKTNRYDAEGWSDKPIAAQVDRDGNLYVTGTSFANSGGYDFATIKFSTLSLLPVPLNISISSATSVLTWTNASFDLQTAPSLSDTFTNIPGATSPYTNPVTDTQRFFRLKAH
jgi:hypothetical protein